MKSLTGIGSVLLWWCCLPACVAPLLAAAQGSAPAEVLVTFVMPANSPPSHSGSQRSYRSGSRWDADLLTRQRARQFAQRYNLGWRAGWPVEDLGVYCVAYTLPDSMSLSRLQDIADSVAYVHRVQANHQFTGMGGVVHADYDDPLFKYQFGEHAHQLVELHKHSRGQQVRVGIIDGPVDTEHPDLLGQIRAQQSFADVDSLQDLKHGTAMAGIIVAEDGNSQGVVGVAPEADVHVFAACLAAHGGTACDSFSIARALQSALHEEMQLLNMSLAGPFDPLLRDLLTVAQQRGMIIVAAQNSLNAERNFPAALDGVFAASGELGYWFTHPEQMTTQAGGGYEVFRGTSVSAAGLTGVAALLRARHNQQDTRHLLEQMQSGCERQPPKLFEHDVCL